MYVNRTYSRRRILNSINRDMIQKRTDLYTCILVQFRYNLLLYITISDIIGWCFCNINKQQSLKKPTASLTNAVGQLTELFLFSRILFILNSPMRKRTSLGFLRYENDDHVMRPCVVVRRLCKR